MNLIHSKRDPAPAQAVNQRFSSSVPRLQSAAWAAKAQAWLKVAPRWDRSRLLPGQPVQRTPGEFGSKLIDTQGILSWVIMMSSEITMK